MDIGLLKSAFAGNVGTKPTLLEPIISPQTKQPTTIAADNVPTTNTDKTATTDNTQTFTRNKAVVDLSKNFKHTLDKKIKKQDKDSGALSEMVPPAAQGILAGPEVLDNAANAKIIDQPQQQAEGQIPSESAQAVTVSTPPSSQQIPSLIVQAAKPITGEPNQIVSTTAESANKPIQPTIDQDQIKSEIILPGISNKLPISNTQFEKDSDIGKMQISDEAFVAKEKLADQENQQSSKESIPQILLSNQKITADSELQIVINEPSAAQPEKGKDIGKMQVSNEAFVDKESPPQTLTINQKITADSKLSVVINEPSVAQPEKGKDIGKTQVSDETFVDKESTSQTLISNQKITADSELPIIINKPSAARFEKGEDIGKMQVSDEVPVAKEKPVNQENQQSGKESIPQILISNQKITADSKPLIVINKPFAAESSKKQLSNGPPAAPGDQSSDAQQKVLAGQERPAADTEQTTPRKTDTGQKHRPNKMDLSGLSENNGVQIKNFSVKPIAQNINPQQTQLSDTYTEIQENLVLNHTLSQNKNPGEQLPGNNVRPAITEQQPTPPVPMAFAKSAGNADSGASVGSQIQESINSSFQSGNQQIVIRLNPPELGKVAIRFTEQGDGITGLLQVDKPQTKDRIQQALPEIIQNLQNSGIQIKRIEVVLTNQQEQYNSKDPSSTGQNGWSGQQNSPNPESQGNDAAYSKWLTTNTDYVPEYMEPQVQFTENSVNMLA